MERFLTGIKASGELHIGNYFGAIKPIIETQKKGGQEIYIFVADLHALTSEEARKNPDTLRANTHNLLLAYLALGLDVEKVVIYRQSDFPQITMLQWIFSCLLTVPYLQRSHAYKAASDKGEVVNVGLMNYPVLMAADILLPNASIVPVGHDQLQHLEIARDIARSFNSHYSDFFTEPKAVVTETPTILGVNGGKMSKSENNTIPIFADKDILHSIISKIKTDSVSKGDPLNEKDCHVFYYHSLFSTKKELEDLKIMYREGKIGYKESKEMLVDKIYSYFADAHVEYQKHILQTDLEEAIFSKHRAHLTKEFNDTLMQVRERVGLKEFPEVVGDRVDMD